MPVHSTAETRGISSGDCQGRTGESGSTLRWHNQLFAATMTRCGLSAACCLAYTPATPSTGNVRVRWSLPTRRLLDREAGRGTMAGRFAIRSGLMRRPEGSVATESQGLGPPFSLPRRIEERTQRRCLSFRGRCRCNIFAHSWDQFCSASEARASRTCWSCPSTRTRFQTLTTLPAESIK